jgi:hypothetical protein
MTLHVPNVLDAPVGVTPAGTASVTTTFVAVDGPAFDTSSEYVNAEPEGTGSAESLFAIERSAAAPVANTGVVTVCELSLVAGSDSLAVTETALFSAPAAPGMTTTVTETADSGAMFPMSHETTRPDVKLQVPCDVVADWNDVPAGSGLLNWTLVAVAGPPLATRMLYVSGAPTTAGFGDAVCVTPTLAVFGSNSQLITAPPCVALRLEPSPGSEADTFTTSGLASALVSFAWIYRPVVGTAKKLKPDIANGVAAPGLSIVTYTSSGS